MHINILPINTSPRNGTCINRAAVFCNVCWLCMCQKKCGRVLRKPSPALYRRGLLMIILDSRDFGGLRCSFPKEKTPYIKWLFLALHHPQITPFCAAHAHTVKTHKNQEAKKPRRTKATKQKARRAKNPKATKAKKPARKAKEVKKQNSVSKCVKYVLIFDVFGCLDMRHLFLHPQTG